MIRLFIAAVPGGKYALALWDLLTSRIGLMLIASVLAFYAGYRMADGSNEVRNLQAQINTLMADLNAARTAEVMARAQAIKAEIEADKNQERVDALEADLAKRAQERSSCALSESDARRLRGIR